MASTTSQPSIPDKSWTNPFDEGSPLWGLFDEVVRQNRDLIIILDDYRARRGTGKTVASLQLASGMDQTEEGITYEKCTLEPEKLRNAYTDLPKRSGLVFDEGEVGASNKSHMSKSNRALREIMSMGRVEQKYVVINAPSKKFIDKDILRLADVWISMTRRGQGLVHFLEHEPYSENLLTRQVQWLNVDDIERGTPLRNVYNRLTSEKKKRIDGGEGGTYVEQSDHEEAVERAKKQARKEQRDDDIRGIANHPEIQAAGVSQRMIGEAIGVSQTTVWNVLNDD